jgi:chemotaxis protein methyltransferase CheR
MERQFRFTETDYGRVTSLLYRAAGIDLGEARKEMVYSRLAREVRRLGKRDVAEYLTFLENAGQHEWTRFVNVLTTNLTSFFREAHHFEMLQREVLPHAGRPARIWSCGCASGEEPYSIAMVCQEHFGDAPGSHQVLATDINTSMLQMADEGVYASERIEGLPAERLRRHFLQGSGAHAGKVKVKPALREAISFRHLNLIDEQWPIKGPFDAIFCRNVMIYFDKPTQYRILARFVPLLRRPHGRLFAGHSEAFFHAKDLFTPLGATTYRLTDEHDGQ